MENVQVIDTLEIIFGNDRMLHELVDHLEEQCKTNPAYTRFLGVCKEKLETSGGRK